MTLLRTEITQKRNTTMNTQRKLRKSEARGLAAGHWRIDKKMFYALGGLSNPDLFRKTKSNGVWTYWRQ